MKSLLSIILRAKHADSKSVAERRHQQTLVLYDPKSRRVVLREASPTAQIALRDIPPTALEPILQTCPLCKRKLSDHDEEPVSQANGQSSGARRSVPLAESGYVDQDYFRMLDITIGSSRRAQGQLPSVEDDSEIEDSDSDGDDLVISEQNDLRSQNTDGIDATAFSPGYYERFFVTERELGRGGKGVVLLVKHMIDHVSLGNFACKRVPVGDNHEWLKKVLVEVQLLQRLSHQNLVSYRHVWLENVRLTNFGPSVPCAFILQQYCNSGDLHNYIINNASSPKKSTTEQLKDRLRRRSRGQPDLPDQRWNPRRLPFEQIISFFRDIAAGLGHLHANGFIHRDLKPSNCLLHEDVPGQGLKVLVSDFGEVQQEDQMRKSTGTTGTISYCAPEVLRRVTPDGDYENFTTKSDVFSLGMILHFICFGRLPYVGADALNEENEDVAALREEITAWQGLEDATALRTDLPERLYHSLKTLISPDPSVRPTAVEILLKIEEAFAKIDQRRGVSGSQTSTIIDDSQALGFRRISPIADTPRPGTPVNGNGNGSSVHEYLTPQTERASTEPLPHSSKPRRSSMLSARPIIETSEPSSPNESLMVVRRRRTESPAPPTSVSGLEPPRQLRPWDQAHRRSQLILALKVTVFFGKMFSLTQPCFPAAVQTWAFYPIVGLGMVDFAA
ncbi:protein kinase [Geopyxis carbonaria]|nr:protein kinase [Geopyxis carbonaria]